MCGINGVIYNNLLDKDTARHHLNVMNQLIKHRGPDHDEVWIAGQERLKSSKCSKSYDKPKLALGHVRLSIIDLSHAADQPFRDNYGNVLVFNGEIYNYLELKEKLKRDWEFKTRSDTEVILAAYNKYGIDCINYFEGMFAFAIWDESKQQLFLARDRVGIKPLYYYENEQGFYFSSEVKALLPFIPELKINNMALTEYFLFQYPLGEEVLFDGVKQLLPGHYLRLNLNKPNYEIFKKQYWNIQYSDKYTDTNQAVHDFNLLMNNAANKHLRSDVPLGSYLSGGVDSSLVTILAKKHSANMNYSINGRFTDYDNFDESSYAKAVTDSLDLKLQVLDISAVDFENNIKKIVYHLDYPIAGPGSFPQYMVSKAASKRVKVMLGGQGGDELFGGYARYLLMYFGDVVNHAIDNNLSSPDLQPSPDNIFAKLAMLKQYKPLFQQYMQQDCFADHARRYYHIINRASDISNQEINWSDLPTEEVYLKYAAVFNSIDMQEDYVLNKVLHFDFKCLLPALLHVEDRVSMAHGIESRVPFLDHRIVELAASFSPNVKFGDGEMKSIIKNTFKSMLPSKILNRTDKMGFPVPLNNWATGGLKDFIYETMIFSDRDRSRDIVNYSSLLKDFDAGTYSRKLWGMLNFELWLQTFFDRHHEFKKLLVNQSSVNLVSI